MGGSGSSSGKGGGGGAGASQRPVLNQRFSIDSIPESADVQRFVKNARPGDMIEVTAHESGDYVGHYTLRSDGKWERTNKYRTNYDIGKTMSNTPKAVAMKIGGADLRLVATKENPWKRPQRTRR